MMSEAQSNSQHPIYQNFKHIVRLDRIKAFDAVNLAEGYGIITILSPKEVNLDE